MIESGYYPPGAEFDPSAPYNQVDPPEIEIEVTVKETLVKDIAIVTNNAWCVADEEGYTSLEDDNFNATDEYREQNELLSVVIAKAKEEITNLRIEAQAHLRKLEEHYGVKRGCIPGCSADDKDKMHMRTLLWDASQRINYLKSLEKGLDGWEHEDIEVER